jgi:hypothetical protein
MRKHKIYIAPYPSGGMNTITDPETATNVQYHSVTITTHDGEHVVRAASNSCLALLTVDSVGIAGTCAGLVTGSFELDAGDSQIELDYQDFTDEYGYDEIRLEFVDNDQ